MCTVVKANGTAAFALLGGPFLLGVLLLASCAKSTPVAATPTGPKRYPLTGEVVAIDAAHDRLTVKHDDVPGLMPGMTMDFAVSAGDVASVHPGERIRAELVADLQAPRLEKIWPDDRAAATWSTSRRRRESALMPAPGVAGAKAGR